MLEEGNAGSAEAAASRTEALQLKNVNVNALNPEILQKFLSSGLEEEVDSFVHDYFLAIGQEPMGVTGVPELCSAECSFFRADIFEEDGV